MGPRKKARRKVNAYYVEFKYVFIYYNDKYIQEYL